ncbi:autotransporter outer membrane beta-barrel domain-containing protein, partial [Ensifer adhaerens]|uniref:autotransporter outer membrane beta-barrel domain-containing protein n=1 Tax=Ensifer adhaerens TaxID=106592 RepID=UPI003D02D311
GTSGSLAGDVTNNGTLTFNRSDAVSFSGDISGTGGLTQAGTGTLTLFGANTYSGATTIDAGTLAAGSTNTFSANSAVTVASGANVNLVGFDQTIAALSGAGNVALGTGTLTVDQSTSTTYSGVLSGSDGFVKDGSGKLLLSGDSSGFTGTTAINGGILSVNGTLGGVINVNSGGTLGGTNGTVGSAMVNAGGTLGPGNSIGTLNVSGNLTFAAGSTYEVEVDAADNNDRTNVSGTATLGGAAVSVLAANGSWNPVTNYTILSATGGVSGSFGEVTSNLAFLTPTLSYDANDVFLKLVRNDIGLASVADTRNQRATAKALEALGSGVLHDAILSLDAATARSAFDQLSGEIYASQRSALIEDSHFIRDAINERLRQSFAGSADLLATASTGAAVGAQRGPDSAVWSRAFGGWQRINGDGNAAGISHDTGGFVAGVDGEAFDDWRLGVIAGYSHSDIDAEGRRTSGDSDNYHLGVYGGREWGVVAFRSGLAYTWNEIATSRSVNFPGVSDRLFSDDRAGTLQGFGELGYRMDTASASFEPFANLAYVSVNGGGFSETGGAAALAVDGDTTSTAFSTLGVRAATTFLLGEALTTASGTIGWRHAYGNTVPTTTNRFADGDAFTVAGAPIARDAALIEAGFETQLTPAATAGLYYNGQFGGGSSANGVNARLAVRF